MDGLGNQEGNALAPVIDRNIRALLQRRMAEERAAGFGDRLASAIARFAGSFWFVALHFTAALLWFAINLGWLPIVEPFDPSFFVLAMTASVEALFLSAFILRNQNRMAALSDRRAELDLQMSLLTEHEITQVLRLVTLIAERLNIAEASDPQLAELAREVAPEQVMDKMQAHEEAAIKDSTV